MQKLAVIYNPASGQNYRGLEPLHQAVAVMRAGGFEVEQIATTAPGSAGVQAKEAIRGGAEIVLACGGDGTVHDVLQGMIGETAVLGILPMGTANALASDLGLPTRDAASAAHMLLSFKPRSLAALKAESNVAGVPRIRYSTVMSGIGANAHLVYELGLAAKQRFGMASYFAYAAYLFATHRAVPFVAEITLSDGASRAETLSELLLVRINQFGFPLRRLAPGAALEHDTVRLVLFPARRPRINIFAYLNGVLLNRRIVPDGVELVDARQIVCVPDPLVLAQRNRIYAQADGEMLGDLPVSFTMVPAAFRMLLPPART